MAAIIVIAVMAAYANTLHVPLLFDDHPALVGNPSIRNLADWRTVLLPPASSPTAGRPVLNLTFALNYALGGTDVRGYHAVNLLIHAAAALALFGLVRRTLLTPSVSPTLAASSTPVAALSALLWAVHPLLTSDVTYISQRAEALMGLFYFLAVYGFVRSVESRASAGWAVFSVAACFGGMATKEVMVTAPLLVLLYDRVFASGTFLSALRVRRGYYAALASSWPLLALLIAGATLGERNVGFEQGVTPWTYALTEARVVVQYLKLALWPSPLVFDYGTELLAEPAVRSAPFVVVLFAIGCGIVWAWRRQRAVAFAVLAALLVLAPTSSLVPIALQPMAESRMYVSLAPIVTLAVAGSFALLGTRRGLVLAAAVAVAAGLVSRARNDDYRTALRLWQDTVAKNPGSSRAHHSLANELARDPQRGAAARAEYEAALRIAPRDAEVHYDFATWLEKQPGGAGAARRHYESALELSPAHLKAHLNLAALLARDPATRPAALVGYEQALRLNPAYADTHYNLGSLLIVDPARVTEGIQHLERALELRPDYAEAHNNLGNALAGLPGRALDAVRHYEEAVRLKPDFAEAHNNLGSVLARLPGRRAEAAAHFREAIRLQPDFAEAHFNLARELAARSDARDEAIAHFRAALRARPTMAIAHNGLAEVLYKAGALDDAIAELEAAVRIDPAYEDARHNLQSLRALKKGR